MGCLTLNFASEVKHEFGGAYETAEASPWQLSRTSRVSYPVARNYLRAIEPPGTLISGCTKPKPGIDKVAGGSWKARDNFQSTSPGGNILRVMGTIIFGSACTKVDNSIITRAEVPGLRAGAAPLIAVIRAAGRKCALLLLHPLFLREIHECCGFARGVLEASSILPSSFFFLTWLFTLPWN